MEQHNPNRNPNQNSNITFTGNPKPFGVIGLVIAIFSMLFSFIPCIGYYAIVPSVLAGIFSLIAFLYARQNSNNTAVPLSGLIISVLALGMGIYQYVTYKEVINASKEIRKSLEQEFDETIKDSVSKVLQKAAEKDSVKTEKDSLQW